MGKSAPVTTAWTPGRAAAREVSIRTMRACGWGLRSSLHQSIREAGLTRHLGHAIDPRQRCAYDLEVAVLAALPISGHTDSRASAPRLRRACGQPPAPR